MSNKLSDFETVALDEKNKALVLIDQTYLPNEIKILHLVKQEDIWEAIQKLRVRGAPAIGVTAAFAIYLASEEISTDDYEEFERQFLSASDYLASSRPTAVNLTWALSKMYDVLCLNKDKGVAAIKEALLAESKRIRDEDIEVCRAIGENALTLLKPGDGLLTHCNAGRLATIKYGTATSPMYLGHEKNLGFRLYCCETRPLLQGSRLTAFELKASGMNPTLLCDNMTSSVMRTGVIDAVFVGCDRVAANGDTANKIGTSQVALAAKYYGIPFYVCAPYSTIDFETPNGNEIVIEQRDKSEVTEMWYSNRMAPKDIKVYNPAFDVTNAELITAIITENGIARPPFADSLQDLKK